MPPFVVTKVSTRAAGDLTGWVNETFRAPRLRRLLPHRGRQRVVSSLSLFETADQTDESTKLVGK
jgi:hypothetical protein